MRRADGHGRRLWAEWRASKGASPKPLTPNQLARLLKPFGIAPTGTIRVGTRTAKGYNRHQFEGAWQRYLAGQGVNKPSQRHNPDEMGTSGTFPTVTPESDVTDGKCEKPAENGHCDGVTVQKADEGTEGCEADEFDERAAILEFDGGLTREQAESRARAELSRKAAGHA